MTPEERIYKALKQIFDYQYPLAMKLANYNIKPLEDAINEAIKEACGKLEEERDRQKNVL